MRRNKALYIIIDNNLTTKQKKLRLETQISQIDKEASTIYIQKNIDSTLFVHSAVFAFLQVTSTLTPGSFNLVCG